MRSLSSQKYGTLLSFISKILFTKESVLVTKHIFYLCVIVCCVLTGSAAFANDQNLPNYTPAVEQGYSEMTGGISLGFDPNDYDFLIYDCGGGENSIQAAMQKIGIQEYTVCDADNAVTSELLQSHDILIVGWAFGGDKSGLAPNVIEQGIAGRAILSGHDSDYHTVNVETEDAATTFFIQEIDYVLQGSGTGLIVCADIDSNFDWLPASWGVESTTNGGAIITEFTQEGLDSGVYDNLTPELMSYWSTSFHNTFTDWGIGFAPFELGKVNDVNSVITIAATINPYGWPFDKEDDVDEADCRSPEEEITYTICYENTTEQTFTDVWIIDYLPGGVTYPEGFGRIDPNDLFNPIPPDPDYDPNTHTYVWEIGDVGQEDANCVSLTVLVNYKAEPGMYLHNVAEIWAGDTLLTKAIEDTPVCCWDTTDPNIIYVDKNSHGSNNGTSWADAYTDLRDALERGRESICFDRFIICVAQGRYSPGNNSYDSFVIPDGTEVYGGFRTGGSDFSERKPKKYRTILAGQIDEQTRADTVVTMAGETRLDGFTVRGAADYGVYGSGVDFTIENCSIKKNEQYGIYAEDGDVTIKWCEVRNNKFYAIRHQGDGFTLTIENTQIRKNMRYGIFSQNSTPTIKNSVISESDLEKEGRQGIRMINPTYSPILHNNTIAHNKAAGIFFLDNGDITGDPNKLDYPDVQNCILWHNNNGGKQVAGFEQDVYASYCCIQDCNEVNFNFSANPKFAYYDPNNVHLAYDSPCKDTGSPNLSYAEQVDMDSENRVVGDYVDVGADELYSCDGDYSEDDFYNSFDWNADGAVNMYEFSKFSSAWLSHDPNDPAWIADPNLADPNDSINWNPVCNLDDTGGSEYVIDLADLVVFTSEAPWLWAACWRGNYIAMYGMMGGGGESMMMSESFTVDSTQAPVPEKTIAEQFEDAKRLIENVEEMWEDPLVQEQIGEKDWLEFMEKIYDWFAELEILAEDKYGY